MIFIQRPCFPNLSLRVRKHIFSIEVNLLVTQNLEKSDSDAETEENEKIRLAEAAESLNKFISFAEASISYSASEINDYIITNTFFTKR